MLPMLFDVAIKDAERPKSPVATTAVQLTEKYHQM